MVLFPRDLLACTPDMSASLSATLAFNMFKVIVVVLVLVVVGVLASCKCISEGSRLDMNSEMSDGCFVHVGVTGGGGLAKTLQWSYSTCC